MTGLVGGAGQMRPQLSTGTCAEPQQNARTVVPGQQRMHRARDGLTTNDFHISEDSEITIIALFASLEIYFWPGDCLR